MEWQHSLPISLAGLLWLSNEAKLTLIPGSFLRVLRLPGPRPAGRCSLPAGALQGRNHGLPDPGEGVRPENPGPPWRHRVWAVQVRDTFLHISRTALYVPRSIFTPLDIVGCPLCPHYISKVRCLNFDTQVTVSLAISIAYVFTKKPFNKIKKSIVYRPVVEQTQIQCYLDI